MWINILILSPCRGRIARTVEVGGLSLWSVRRATVYLYISLVLHCIPSKMFALFQAKEFGRRAVVASEGVNDEEFSKKIVEFMKMCELIPAK